MTQWQTRCGLCRNFEKGLGCPCHLTIYKFEPILCTASNITVMLPREQWSANINTETKKDIN